MHILFLQCNFLHCKTIWYDTNIFKWYDILQFAYRYSKILEIKIDASIQLLYRHTPKTHIWGDWIEDELTPILNPRVEKPTSAILFLSDVWKPTECVTLHVSYPQSSSVLTFTDFYCINCTCWVCVQPTVTLYFRMISYLNHLSKHHSPLQARPLCKCRELPRNTSPIHFFTTNIVPCYFN